MYNKRSEGGVDGDEESEIGQQLGWGWTYILREAACSLTWENETHIMIVARMVIFVLELVVVFYLRKYHDGSQEYKLGILNWRQKTK